jgi:hypothetical protein
VKKRRKTTKEANHDGSTHVKKHEKKSALERSKSITYRLKSYDFNLYGEKYENAVTIRSKHSN